MKFKSLAITSLLLVLVPALIFLPVYVYLLHTAEANAQDYSDDIQGSWSAFQYYHGNERVACNDEDYMRIKIDGDVITVEGTVLPETVSTFSWDSGTSLTYETAQGESFTYLMSFDSGNNLKIIVDGTSYIILLRRS